jgi:RNA recognition motif-containing protein
MGGTRVYVGGLPYGVREKDLERFFKGYGRIRDILIKNGYGFVVSLYSFISQFGSIEIGRDSEIGESPVKGQS